MHREYQSACISARLHLRYWVQIAVVLAAMFPARLDSGDFAFVEVRLPAGFSPFDSGADGQYQPAAALACKASKPDSFAGYRWSLPRVARLLRSRPGSDEGKQIYIGYLKTKYGYRIQDLNKAYSLDAQSFTELLDGDWSDKAGASGALARDDEDFESPLRREMHDAIIKELSSCDPAHAGAVDRLVLRFLSGARAGARIR